MNADGSDGNWVNGFPSMWHMALWLPRPFRSFATSFRGMYTIHVYSKTRSVCPEWGKRVRDIYRGFTYWQWTGIVSRPLWYTCRCIYIYESNGRIVVKPAFSQPRAADVPANGRLVRQAWIKGRIDRTQRRDNRLEWESRTWTMSSLRQISLPFSLSLMTPEP